MHSKTDTLQRYQTKDGSWTLFDPKLGEHYRSTHGAQTESRHVFMGGTRLFDSPDEGVWRVIELGFGSAVNVWNTANFILTEREHQHLEYHSIEWKPIDASLLEHMTGPVGAMIHEVLEEAAARELGEDNPGVVHVQDESGRVRLWLHVGAREQHRIPAGVEASAIYHDPFSPKVNPGGWTAQAFAFYLPWMTPQTVLATYGSSSAARRAMCEAGLHVGNLPGPGWKREISVAAITPEAMPHAKVLKRSRYLKQGP